MMMEADMPGMPRFDVMDHASDDVSGQSALRSLSLMSIVSVILVAILLN